MQFSVLGKNGFWCTLVEEFNPRSVVFVPTLKVIGMSALRGLYLTLGLVLMYSGFGAGISVFFWLSQNWLYFLEGCKCALV